MNRDAIIAELSALSDDALQVALQAGRALTQSRTEQFYFLHSFLQESFAVESWDESGECSVTLPITEYILNPAGMVHGGVLALLCDNVMGLASHLQSKRPGVTVDLAVKYHKPARGSCLVAKASVLSAGANLLSTKCTVRNDRDILVASAVGTFYHRREKL